MNIILKNNEKILIEKYFDDINGQQINYKSGIKTKGTNNITP